MSLRLSHWNGDDFLVAADMAAERALDQVAIEVQWEVKRTLKKHTTGVVGKKKGRNIYRASMPGTPPGWRTGRLANSTDWDSPGKLRRRVGTTVEYARIHEVGGTIRHPGGTRFITVGGRFVPLSERKALELRLRGYWVGKTKPFNITMPRRPYLKPSLNTAFGSGRAMQAFDRQFKKDMKYLRKYSRGGDN